ncbi:cation transporter [Tistrella bauzanensis]|uniref:Cation transporter n=1 Tax=Tistrella bauzanensis TaxID=657419 RepID=A0ABQ1ICM2_9PROT|nr:cation diffusion facilitator family transporter [Tistrella bauzanensis]GGB31015.1 cation transporter [Tistrella bauzanensis]
MAAGSGQSATPGAGSAKAGSKRTIYTALAGNLLIAITKFAAAWYTGSSAMLSEGVHSLVDTSNEILLLHGIRRSTLPPDAVHPMGHGRELYFWSFVVAVLVFALGAGVSFYEGVSHVLNPEPATNLTVSYIVLAASAVFEGYSWWVALVEFRRRKGGLGYLEAVRASKDPTSFTVLLEDSAALLGIGIAFIGILAADLLDMPALDGVASIGIALVLAVTATLLARESMGLLIGERASPALQAAVLAVANGDPAIRRANGVITVHLAPDQVMVALSAEFEDHVSTPDIEACIERLERHLYRSHPEIRALFVKPQMPDAWRRQISSAGGTEKAGRDGGYEPAGVD